MANGRHAAKMEDIMKSLIIAACMAAIIFGTFGCQNERTNDQLKCEGNCLEVGFEPGRLPCDGACSPNESCIKPGGDMCFEYDPQCYCWQPGGPIAQCGNGVLDAGEECDMGNGCLQNCTCFGDTVSNGQGGCMPPSGAVCGNGVVEAGEECDSGSGCLQNCQCFNGMLPNGQGGCAATGPVCGNGIIETGEQCDGGSNCLSGCVCPQGYTPNGQGGCTAPSGPVCGNNILETGEQCDGGSNCLSGCVCPQGYTPNGQGGCTAPSGPVCGNGIVETGEQCDDGSGCLQTCQCLSGLIPDGLGGCYQPSTGEEICDTWNDEDGDGLVSAADPDCINEIVGTLGIYNPPGGTPICDSTGDGQLDGTGWLIVKTQTIQVELCLAPDTTYPFNYNGADKYVQFWVESYDIEVSSGKPFQMCTPPESTWFPGWPSGCLTVNHVDEDAIPYTGQLQIFNIRQYGPGAQP